MEDERAVTSSQSGESLDLGLEFSTTEEIKVPEKLIDQVIGQEHAVEVIKTAAGQKRHVLLIGEPGTGKSMLGQAMAELLPTENLEDILVFPNPEDENMPRIKTVPACQGRRIVEHYREKARSQENIKSYLLMAVVFMVMMAILIDYSTTNFLMGLFVIILTMMVLSNMRMRTSVLVPKLLVDNCGRTKAPFVDATGAHAGALLGDVRHDPFQCFSGKESVIVREDGKIKALKLEDFVEEALKTPSGEGMDGEIKVIYHDFRDKNVEILTKEGFTKLLYANKRLGRQKLRRVVNLERDYWFALTPEHKVYTAGGLKEAGDITVKDGPIRVPVNVLDEFAIARTYDGEEKLRGYPNRLGKGATPKSLKMIEELKAPNLLPLTSEDERLEKAALLLGALFRGGNIDGNLRTLSFASSEREAVERFAETLKELFGEFNYEIKENRRAGGSILFRTRDRRIISFFVALGGPVGKEIKPELPWWIRLKPSLFLAFFDGLYSGDGSVFFTREGTKFNGTLEVARPTDEPEKELPFFQELAWYLGIFGIEAEVRVDKATEEHRVGLVLSQSVDSLLNLLEFVPMTLSPTRRAKLLEDVKKALEEAGGGAERLEKILKGERRAFIETWEEVEVTYNLTTEEGNLLANGLFVKNSGGLGTPAHERVEPGMIHRAHKGVLFIDEIATLSLKMQQSLLTAMQEKKFPITGQSELSSGAMVRTEPVPCDFILVAAGNLDTVDKMHPALRSRIRGYGYEVYMRTTMPDTPENRRKLVQFVAQEVKRDGKIPHFTRDAVEEIVREAQKRAGRKGHLTLRLRDLGGIVRAAGDIAIKKGKKYVDREDVLEAMKIAKPLEKQLADWYIENKKEYQVIKTEGGEIGRVNGLAVIGEQSGIVLPIEAVVAPAASKEEGKIIVTGKLGEIAKEAVQNVSAIIKRYKGEDISQYDIHVQFLQTYEGVEGDSASISVATAVISALEEIPIRQDVAMTGSLSVRGEVLPIGGATPKIEAAIEAGIKTVIIPKSNEKDVFLSPDRAAKIRIMPVETIDEVLEIALADSPKKEELLRKIRESLPLKKA
ncbi:ATP-dependent protease LonB [Thermococcus zilligii]|uniref:ATP-dependent protease LonB n=1 Tax=Thermococcus zilligii TaxID=54076 RepID=UPI00029B1E7B